MPADANPLDALNDEQRAAVDQEHARVMDQVAGMVPGEDHAAVHAHCEDLHRETAEKDALIERWKAYATGLATRLQMLDETVEPFEGG